MVSGLHPSVTPAPIGALTAFGRLVWGSFYGAAPRSCPVSGAGLPDTTTSVGGRQACPRLGARASAKRPQKGPPTVFLGYRRKPARS